MSFSSLVAEAAGRPFAFIVGWPVEQSRSPRLHGYWLAERGIAGFYGRLPVPSEDGALRRAFDFIRTTPNARGCNITAPHKVAAFDLLDHIDPSARRIGAINTVVKRDDGSLEGRNTDGFGFLANLRAGAPAGWSVEAGPAVVLGAGGAVRALLVSLLDAGAPRIRLTNRTRASAEALAGALDPERIDVVDWSMREATLDGANLLVNGATLGMKGAPPLELDLARLPSAALVHDIVYSPLVTDLLTRAAARGHPTVDGLGMLLHQGRPGFAAWFGGAPPEVTPELRRAVAGDLGA